MKTNQIEILNTSLGHFYLNESLSLLSLIDTNSIDLIITSPPFAFENQDKIEKASDFIDWLNLFFQEFNRILKPTGNLIFELSSIWDTQPSKLTHVYQFISQLNSQWVLLQELFWHTPDLLPTPIQLNFRFKDEVSIIWWLAKQVDTTIPNSDIVSSLSVQENGNLFKFRDSFFDKDFTNKCINTGLEPFTARYPISFPLFFIQLLTNQGDLILDPFAGIGTTGAAAEQLKRKWICIENEVRLLPYINLFFKHFKSIKYE